MPLELITVPPSLNGVELLKRKSLWLSQHLYWLVSNDETAAISYKELIVELSI